MEFPRHNLSINQIKYLRKVSSKQIGFGCLRDTAKPASGQGPAVFISMLKIEKGKRKKRDYTSISVIKRPQINFKNHSIRLIMSYKKYPHNFYPI